VYFGFSSLRYSTSALCLFIHLSITDAVSSKKFAASLYNTHFIGHTFHIFMLVADRSVVSKRPYNIKIIKKHNTNPDEMLCKTLSFCSLSTSMYLRT
jgi:hypothetical protein